MSNLWLLEMNLSDLYNATDSFHGKKISAADFVNILEVKYDLLPPNSLVVKGSIQGSDAEPYLTVIKFLDVSLRGRTPIETLQGNIRISKINPRKNDVQVFCPCNSFKWAFNTPNHRVDALYDPERNLRTERPKGTGIYSPNVTGVAGLCKHLIALANFLQDNGIINNI